MHLALSVASAPQMVQAPARDPVDFDQRAGAWTGSQTNRECGQDEYCFYNGKTHWEPSRPVVGAAGCFVPFAVCVVSRFPYYNSLKDCLSW
ncbi:hypothetical protein P7K49_026507 [Saguinus oedipus]|uniref:Secreted protein n=1 Tax=Saguinus oedipus TaxID=9490 RepID=A0ABQ9UDT6_SAGOE|nr:hypothetical protein P7K49_026507 [Saguinus oedipus]